MRMRVNGTRQDGTIDSCEVEGEGIVDIHATCVELSELNRWTGWVWLPCLHPDGPAFVAPKRHSLSTEDRLSVASLRMRVAKLRSQRDAARGQVIKLSINCLMERITVLDDQIKKTSQIRIIVPRGFGPEPSDDFLDAKMVDGRWICTVPPMEVDMGEFDEEQFARSCAKKPGDKNDQG